MLRPTTAEDLGEDRREAVKRRAAEFDCIDRGVPASSLRASTRPQVLPQDSMNTFSAKGSVARLG